MGHKIALNSVAIVNTKKVGFEKNWQLEIRKSMNFILFYQILCTYETIFLILHAYIISMA